MVDEAVEWTGKSCQGMRLDDSLPLTSFNLPPPPVWITFVTTVFIAASPVPRRVRIRPQAVNE